MYQPFLFLHWKTVRLGLLPAVIAAFGLPLLSVQGLGPAPGMETTTLEAYRMVDQFQLWLPAYPLLAAAVGTLLALSAWHWDHTQKHVYALSLPVARWEYAMHKLAAGATLALVPAAALWIGALMATASVSLPEGLHTYPTQLAVRFLFATLVAYAFLFSLAAGTVRTTAWVLSAMVLVPLLAGMSGNALQHYFPSLAYVHPGQWIADFVTHSKGPLEVFFGNWALIDV